MLCVLSAWWSGAQPADAPAEFELRIRSLGVGGFARAGDWAGVQIEFVDLGARQRDVLFQIETRDVDGDRPTFRRTVTTNPGAAAEQLWLYAFLQPDAGDDPATIAAFEALPVSAEEAERTGVRFRPGRLLARISAAGQDVAPPENAAIPIVGRAPAGMALYERRERDSDLWIPGGHEVTRVLSGLTPDDLPDRVVGLLPFESLVWTNEDPTRLTALRAEALQRWVEAGGHLVISLADQPMLWQDRSRNPLAALVPEVDMRPAVLRGVDLEALRPLLTYAESARLPAELSCVVLTPAEGADASDASVLLRDGAGRALAARRVVGLGTVTLLGLDVASPALTDLGLPGAQPLWHRVLGRVGVSADDQRSSSAALSLSVAQPRYFDLSIASAIAKGQAVLVGVIAGFAVFGLYWALAGPLSFIILAKLGLKRHAWLGFTGVGVVFTAVSWGLVNAVRPSTPNAAIVAFIDAVDGSDLRGGRAFASVLVPRYGLGRLSVSPDLDEGFGAVAAWTADRSLGVSAGNAFPDARPYPVAARDPSVLEFPARATVKTVRVDWLGEPVWAMPRAIDTDGREGSIRLDANGRPAGRAQHGLPGPLRDGLLVVVPRQAPLWRQVGRSDIADVRVYSLAPQFRAWEAGVTLDLGVLTAPPTDAPTAGELRDRLDAFADLLDAGSSDLAALPGTLERPIDPREQLVASAFMTRFRPPALDTRGDRRVALRRHTHGLDLGQWFTQPCVMIIGIVDIDESMPSPVPLRIGEPGEEQPLPASGLAVVRWVYPLPADPPEATRTTTP